MQTISMDSHNCFSFRVIFSICVHPYSNHLNLNQLEQVLFFLTSGKIHEIIENAGMITSSPFLSLKPL